MVVLFLMVSTLAISLMRKLTTCSCVAPQLLIELYGPAERSFTLPSESDGPGDALGIDMHWRRNGEQFGITLDYKTERATVSWGAQAESPE